MIRTTLTLLATALSTAALAQDTTQMETDRPDQTETPVLVRRGYFQAEIGVLRENQDGRNYLLSAPTALLKYGISRRFEFRLEATRYSQYLHLIPDPVTISGFAPIEVGTKVALFDEKGARPQTSFIGHIGITALSSEEFKPQEPIASLRFAMQNTLSRVVKLGYNIGLDWSGESSSPDFVYTFAPGFDISEKWYAFIEVFGSIGKEDAHDHNVDAGIAYRVNRNLQLDISAGKGLSKESSESFLSAGISFRLPVRK
ncbi:MAG: transporter [Flaviaesturariibacter sp.]|nr:transporter [Flaviaesturariibacter sp.]